MRKQELDILIALAEAGDGATMRDVVDRLHCSRFTFFYRVCRLEEAGLVAVDAPKLLSLDPERYSVTDAGRDALREHRRELETELQVIQGMIATTD